MIADTRISFQERIWKQRLDLLGIGLRRYPDFVLGERALSLETDIPVFVFHGVEPVRFAEQLRYLQDNDYRVLSTADELIARLRGAQPRTAHTVLLTFDDGLESLYTVAFPLLRKYGMAAVAFVVPGVLRVAGV